MRFSHDVYGPGARPGARVLLASRNVDYDRGDLIRLGFLSADGEVPGPVLVGLDAVDGSVTIDGGDGDDLRLVDDYGQDLAFEDDADDTEAGDGGGSEVEASDVDVDVVLARGVELGVELGARWGLQRRVDTILAADALVAGRSRDELIERATELDVTFDVESTSMVALAEEIAAAEADDAGGE